ncbi:MAG: hypothetical protein ABTA23_11735, partial [Solibacillus sp.]
LQFDLLLLLAISSLTFTDDLNACFIKFSRCPNHLLNEDKPRRMSQIFNGMDVSLKTSRRATKADLPTSYWPEIWTQLRKSELIVL